MTLKHMKKGHPWVTLDSFSKKFPKGRTFLIGTTGGGHESCVLINDPDHKDVKARVWSTHGEHIETIKSFPQDLYQRLKSSFQKRANLNITEERDNYYLAFGEADGLPGLFILVLGNEILLQYYANYWKQMEMILLPALANTLKAVFPNKKSVSVWAQERNHAQETSFRKLSLPGMKNKRGPEEFYINELGLKYKIKLDSNYDFGIYTDMSAIRKTMAPLFKQSKSVLNLFSYTGAYSLFALKQGVQEVCSVDLSGKYLDWLNENIDLNEDLDINKHISKKMPVEKALTQFIKDDKKFDLIVCDPPSASSDGKRTTSAIKNYDKLLPQIVEATEVGGKIMLFLNTHRITWNKFSDTIQKIISTPDLKGKVVIAKRMKMAEDCLGLQGFPEGDYLKGLLLEKRK
jgi:23S rRNA (cytosine1962-C5)-methyltransferase